MPPSPELVERVRDLYHKRVPDVRFLIPVINGLEKVVRIPMHPTTVNTCSFAISLYLQVVFSVFSVQNEVIQALPKLIKLNPIVVKEVFNRLLGTQHSKTPLYFNTNKPQEGETGFTTSSRHTSGLKQSSVYTTGFCSSRKLFNSHQHAQFGHNTVQTASCRKVLIPTVKPTAPKGSS